MDGKRQKRKVGRMRLIDADALLTDRRMRMYYHLPNGDTAIPVIDIEHAPTIEERKTGEWIIHETENDRYDDVICPFCRKSYTVDAYRIDDIGFTAEDFNFCPNCGADMRGGTNETNSNLD